MKTDRTARPTALTASDRVRMASPARAPRRAYAAVRTLAGAALAVAALPVGIYAAGIAASALTAAGYMSHVVASAGGAVGAFTVLALFALAGRTIMASR